MPPKQRRTTSDPPPDIETEEETSAPTNARDFLDRGQDRSLAAEIDGFLAQLGNNVKVTVRRQGPGEPEAGYIGSFDASGFSLDWLMDEWGGGKYILNFTSAGKAYGSKTFSISPRVKGRIDREEKGGGGVDQSALQTAIQRIGSGGDMSTMVEFMRTMSEKSDKTMALMMQMNQESSKTQMMLMAEIIKASRPPNPTDSLGALGPALAEAIKGNRTAGDPMTQLKTFIEFQTLIREASGDGGNDDGEKPLLEKVVELLGQGAAAFMTARNGTPPATIPAPTTAGEPQVDNQALISMQLQELKNSYRKYLPRLVKAADRKQDVTGIAETILTWSSDEQIQLLAGVLQHEQWVALLFDGNEEVVKRREWFDELRQALLSMIAGGAEPESEEPQGDAAYQGPFGPPEETKFADLA